MTKKPIGELGAARARIKELEYALSFYADKKVWVYRIDKCYLEISVHDGKLVVPAYPFVKFPALEDYGRIAQRALGRKE